MNVDKAGDNKRKCAEVDLLSNKRTCLSPSVTEDDSSVALLPSSIHDSPAMPVPFSSHDPSVTPPQSSLDDDPHPSSHEHPATPPQSSSKDLVSSPTSHDPPTTPPVSHPSLCDGPAASCQSEQVDTLTHKSHNSTTMSPNLHDSLIKLHSSSHDTIPSHLEKDDIPLQHDCTISVLPDSPTPPLLTADDEQDQLEFSDPTVDIINTQLNRQITDVQRFLKTDRLKRTKVPDTNTVQ